MPIVAASAWMPPWQTLVPMVGMLLLIPGLLVRSEYRDALLPRILVTIGVIVHARCRSSSREDGDDPARRRCSRR